jgi:phospholipase C
MVRRTMLLFWLSFIASLVVSLTACGGGSSSASSMQADFQISTTALSPSSVAIPSSASSTITTTAVGGFNGSAALSCSGLPGGVNCSFSPLMVTGSGTSQLTVDTSSTATTPGTYSFTVQGTSGSLNHTAPLTLTITAAVASKIQHVVIIFQENRTTDNLFQDPNLIAKGADIQNYGINSQGQKITLTPYSLVTPFDHSHKHDAFVEMCDLDPTTNQCKMDGADKILTFCVSDPNCTLPPNSQFQYATPSDVQPYYTLAETYTFGDRMFQTNQGPSFPAHQFIISGTSAPTPPGSSMSNLFAAENPLGAKTSDIDNDDTGCTAPPAEYVNLIDPATGDESQQLYPCYDHPTLTDHLNQNKITWRYYGPGAGSIWTAPNAIEHMCVPNVPPPNGTVCTGADWTNNVVLETQNNPAQILTDINNGDLRAVTWVNPGGLASDHSGINNGSGPSWVASIVNAIGNSPFWANTAIIITWDDWGGWYDHVNPPALLNQYEFGFRVPLIVVSPYVKAANITHTVYDFGSILKFIENTFNLPNVAPGAQPAYADTFTQTGDLSDCFNFSQTPLTFKTIAAPLDAKHFINDRRPQLDPDDDQ